MTTLLPLAELPEETLLHIFGYLSTCQILKNIALVCKRFYRICLDDSLITEMYFGRKINHNSLEYAKEVLSRSYNLTKLILQCCENTNLLIYSAIEFCPKLNHIEIMGCYLTEDCFETLIESRQNIQHLSLTGTCIKSNIGGITKLKKLKRLKLSDYNYKFNSYDLICLANNCEQLKSLTVDRVGKTTYSDSE